MNIKRKIVSLNTKLVFFFFSLSAIALLLSGTVQIVAYYQIQQESIVSKQDFIMRNVAAEVINFVQMKFVAMETASLSFNIAGKSYEKQLSIILNGLIGQHETFRHLVLLNKSGEVMTGSTRYPQIIFNKFIDMVPDDLLTQIDRDNHYISEVYFDKMTNEPMVMMAIAVKNVLGEMQNAFICEATLKFMRNLFANLVVGKSGYAYVVDRSGTIIAYKDQDLVLKRENVSSIRIVDAFLKNSDFLENNIQIYNGITGNNVVGRYIPLKTPDWAVIIELPVEEAFREVWANVIITVIITLIMAVISGFIGLILARRISSPLITLCSKFKTISEGEGDLTFQLVVKTNDEMRELANYFNKFIKKLSSLINKTKSVSNENKQMGNDLATHTGEVSAAITEISTTMRAITQKIEYLDGELKKVTLAAKQVGNFIEKVVMMINTQSSSVEESSSAIQEMIASITSITKITGTKKELTVELAMLARDGSTSLTRMVNSITDISKSVEDMLNIIEIINNVASQTDLLAMNAAIEASHAGEAGKGFSVIAEEIRNLADTTAINTKEISKALKSIIDRIEDSKAISYQTNLIISKLISGIKQITDTMSEILNGLSEVNTGSEQITTALGNLVSTTEEVKTSSNDLDKNYADINKAIDIAYKLSDDNKNAIEEISATVVDISKSIYSLTGLTNKNIGNLLTLDESIAKFKTE